MVEQHHHVVFIDGICVLCNRLSKTLIRLDTKKRFLFSTINSRYAKKVLGHPKTDSIIVRNYHGKVYTKSQAILWIMRQLPYVNIVGVFFQIIPTPILDYLYLLIAKRRYHWFGKYDNCPIQTHHRFIKD
jgi:predicted DCC family thiol-disulfide oxidoreductase YuxK